MKKKNIWITVICISVLLFIVGISYAYWSLTFTQTDNNVVMSDCFEIEFLESDAIHLIKAYPVSDEEGLQNIPYTFQIQNTCNIKASYQINLEEIVIEGKQLRNQYIKVSLNGRVGKLLNEIEEVKTTLENADLSHKLTSGVLKPQEKRSYELRIWMEESTPAIEEVMNASFESKITIQAIANENIPEVEVSVVEHFNGIVVDVGVIQNEANEELKYYYQLNEESEKESEESSYTFSDLSDGTYQVRVRVETKSGIIIEEKEIEVNVAYENVYVSSSGNDEVGNGSLEKPYVSLQAAYNKVKSGGNIFLLSDITSTKTTNMDITNKEVTIQSNGNDVYSIYRGDELKTSILDISNTNNITTINVIFDGRNVEATVALLLSTDSTLNLNEGTIVQNAVSTSNYGAGVYSLEGILNINGAFIVRNRITSPTYAQGAGVMVRKGILNMTSGEISYNEALLSSTYGGGGGIFSFDSQVNIQGGIISNNKGKYGGGINFDGITKDITMTITGGSIINNEAKIGGGIQAYRQVTSIQSIVYLKNGIVTNNTAPTNPNFGSDNGVQIFYI